MTFLAFGIRFEDGTTNSIGTHSQKAEQVAKELEDAFGYNSGFFDEIFLIENTKNGPEVKYHWNADKDF